MKAVRFEHDDDTIEVSPVPTEQEGQPMVRFVVFAFCDDTSDRHEVSMSLPVLEARELADYIAQMARTAEAL